MSLRPASRTRPCNVLVIGTGGAGNAAWSERMTQQAQYLQDRAAAARAADAWSTRLTGLAAIEGKAPAAPAAVGMSDRAIAAWADRLTGLAEYYAAQK
jgi:hypothetical protein